uniref:DUF6602 domain-containing protein n=1 Tax=Cupriavidus taiwanensis TaxID=164546 RepID=UPI0011C07C8D|nr:DUF6602 domain-containing protein [Cupriavidus taiwanensis]
MWTTFKESDASARPDHKGGPREQRVRDFLRERLPSKFGVARAHIIFGGDSTSTEFDVVIYDAVNCPRWKLDASEDPRMLIPIEAVVGIVEVKSTLDQRTLDSALDKFLEFDEIVKAQPETHPYAPFRHLFSYRIDADEDFEGWFSPGLRLTRYAGTRCQPDGVFILDSEFHVLDRGNGIARTFAIHRGRSVDEIWIESWDIQNEIIRRGVMVDPSHCNDYISTKATGGLLLLAFLTFALEHASKYAAPEINFADVFSRWGGPMLGGLWDLGVNYGEAKTLLLE